MGKATGFLEYNRKEPGYRPRDERLRDHKAVEFEPSEKEIYQQAARCMDCGIPFCHGYGCPVSNVIPEFNDLVYRDHWQEALDILLSTNNFPEFTGRLCPAPCETACVTGIHTDPVTIRQIEIAIIENSSIINLLTKNYLWEISEDQELDKNKKINLIRSYLKQRRFPEITKAEKKLEKKIKSLNLGRNIKLIVPKNFEATTFSLNLQFDNMEQLRKNKTALEKIIKNPLLKDILV